MTCYELSRVVQVEANPNRDKPKLSLGGLRKPPLASPVVEVVIPEQHTKAQRIESRGLNFEILVSDVQRGATLDVQSPAKSAHDPQPFIEIQGQVYPNPPSWTTPEERRAALGRWISLIVREVGRTYETKSERDAVAEFVRSHRLSIANAFHRKLVRGDVVEALTRLDSWEKALEER